MGENDEQIKKEGGNRNLFLKTALKLLAFGLLAVVAALAAGGFVVVLTNSGEIGLLAMMGAGAGCLFILPFIYPIAFKDFKVYWDKKEEMREKNVTEESTTQADDTAEQ